MYTLYLIVLSLIIETAYSNTLKVKNHNYNQWQNAIYEFKLQKEFDDWSDQRHKTLSHTLTGEICIDNCVDGTCITGWDYNTRKACVEGKEKVPVYFTTRTQKKAVCLSRCGYFGWSYEWCLVTKEGHWDYCSSETNNKKIKVHLTTDGTDRCATKCELNNGEHTCENVWGVRKECNHEKTIDFVQAKTVYGVPCASMCYRYQPDKFTMSYYMCYDYNGNNQYCAPPAENFGSHTENMYKKLHPQF